MLTSSLPAGPPHSPLHHASSSLTDISASPPTSSSHLSSSLTTAPQVNLHLHYTSLHSSTMPEPRPPKASLLTLHTELVTSQHQLVSPLMSFLPSMMAEVFST